MSLKRISLLISIFLIYTNTSNAQQYLSFASGELMREKKYSGYEGNPYLFKDFTLSTVNNKYINVWMNVDLYDNTVLFSRNDSQFIFSEVINEFNISTNGDTTSFKRANLIHPAMPIHFAEIISMTPVLLKVRKKDITELATYGTEKKFRFVEQVDYYTITNGAPNKIRLSKQEAQTVFGNKWKELENHASGNKISFKTEEGWRNLIKYYQSL